MALHLVLESQLLEAIGPLCDSVRSLKVAQFIRQDMVDAVLRTLGETHAALHSWRQVVNNESSGGDISRNNADSRPVGAFSPAFLSLGRGRHVSQAEWRLRTLIALASGGL